MKLPCGYTSESLYETVNLTEKELKARTTNTTHDEKVVLDLCFKVRVLLEAVENLNLENQSLRDELKALKKK